MPKGCIARLTQRHTLLRAIMPLATAFVKTATALQLVSSMTVMSVASLSWAGAFPSASPERALSYSLILVLGTQLHATHGRSGSQQPQGT